MKASFHHLRDRAVLQTRSFNKDNQGGFQEFWLNLAEIWIKLVPRNHLLKHELEQLRGIRRGSLEGSILNAQVTMRSSQLIKVGMRVIHKNRTYVVSSQPIVEKGYQFFDASGICISDGSPL